MRHHQPYSDYETSRKSAISVSVRRYNARIDGVWTNECDRLAQALRNELGIQGSSSSGIASAQVVDRILLEFSSKNFGPTHVFEAASQDQVFSAIATRLAVLPDPEGSAVIICGFVAKQLACLEAPKSCPVPAATFRSFQSALFLAFLAGWVSQRGLSSELEYAVKSLAQSSMVAR